MLILPFSDSLLVALEANKHLGGRMDSCLIIDERGFDLRMLEEMGEIFMGNVHKDKMVYLEDPKPTVPASGQLPVGHHNAIFFI